MLQDEDSGMGDGKGKFGVRRGDLLLEGNESFEKVVSARMEAC